jgi:hypothetical protein
MFEGQVHDPKLFIAVLREFHDAEQAARGSLANALADAIVTKHVDLAAVRQELLDTGAHELMETLERLTDLIQPYIEEGGVEE